jgi:hypothetical protein
MNERIKQLYDQAIIIEDGGDYVCGELDPAKFAELIVQECADIVEHDMKLAHIQMIPLTLEKYANSRLKEKIREHFGVEE